MRLPASRTAVFILALLAGAACTAAPDSEHRAVRGSLDEVFRTDAVITLGEDPRDSIATPGLLAERANGGFLLSDGQLPRIRSYDEDGRLEAAFGRFGEGPFEFQGINGLAETASGAVAVLDARQARLTYLTGNLDPDTTVQLPGVPLERPYWASMVRFSFDVAGDSIYMTSSLRYPIAILSAAGDSIGEIGVPSATFEPVPVFEQGAFNPGAYVTQMPQLLGGRSTISHIAVVGPRLVVVHGRYETPGSGERFGSYHASLDVYDRHTGGKLYEDVPLPEHSRVLRGGRHLHLLKDRRFPPWRIAKLSFLEANPD